MLLEQEQQTGEFPMSLDRAERIRLLELATEAGSPPEMLAIHAREYEQYVLTGRVTAEMSTEGWADMVSHHEKGN